jgi:hypothetical protein
MSASRSVAAAQRRRAGPPEPQINRGPNTSINSSQVFSQNQQLKPGTTGRLAGQQAALQQQQYLQGQSQSQSQNQNSNQGTSKMSVPQAITLITLRLGRIEHQLQNLDPSSNNEGMDSSLIDSILQRLDMLEHDEKPNTINSSQVQDEFLKIKQQLEINKTGLTSIRNSSAVNTKDVRLVKNEIELLRKEFLETKNIINNLNVTYNDINIDEQVEYIDIETETLIAEDVLDEPEPEKELEFFVHNPDQEQNSLIEEVNDPVFDSNIILEQSLEQEPELETEKEIETETEKEIEPVSLKEIIQQELKQSGVSIIAQNPNFTSKRSSKQHHKGAK